MNKPKTTRGIRRPRVPSDKPLCTTSMWLSVELRDAVDREAEAAGVSRAALMRQVTSLYLAMPEAQRVKLREEMRTGRLGGPDSRYAVGLVGDDRR